MMICNRCLRTKCKQTLIASIAWPWLGFTPAWTDSNVTVVSEPKVTIEIPLTVEQAVDIALKNHPDSLIAELNVKTAHGQMLQSRSQLLPSLNFGSTFSRSMSSGSNVVGGVSVGGTDRRFATQYSNSFQLSQLLFDFGRSRDSYESSWRDLQATGHDLEQTREDLINNAQQAFIVLATNTELLLVVKDAVQLQEQTLESARARFEAGVAPRADVVKAESNLAAAKFDVTSAENSVSVSRVALNQAMGIDVQTLYDLAVLPEPELTKDALGVLIATSMKQRPEVRSAQERVQAAKESYDSASKGRLPSVNLGASYGRREEEFPPSPPNWNLNLSLNFNLFDGGSIRGEKEQSDAQLRIARATLYRTQQSVSQEVAKSYLDLSTAQDQIVSGQAAVTSAEENMRLAQGRYRAGVGILLEVTEGQAALTEARANLAKARLSLWSSRYALERAVGAPPKGLDLSQSE